MGFFVVASMGSNRTFMELKFSLLTACLFVVYKF